MGINGWNVHIMMDTRMIVIWKLPKPRVTLYLVKIKKMLVGVDIQG